MRPGTPQARLGPPGGLTASASVTVTANNQIVEGLFIQASGTAIDLAGYDGVTVRNCLILYNCAGGSTAYGATGASSDNVTIEDCQFINMGIPARGAATSAQQNCINLTTCAGVTITRVTVQSGSSGIYLLQCSNTALSYIEGHDMRGPMPRGQLVQWNTCTGTNTLTNWSYESIPGTSWDEDNLNVFATDGVVISNGVIPFGSDSTNGSCIMVEQDPTQNVSIDNVELGYYWNTGIGIVEPYRSISYTNIRLRGYQRYSERNPTKPISGANSPLAVSCYSATSPYVGMVVDIEYHRANMTNFVYQSANIATYTPVALDWTSTLSVIRNAFSWRSTAGAPLPDLQPRIGSYWLDGRIATSLVAGTSILGLLPGRYKNDPTTRSFQWRKDGTNISGATGIDYDVLVGDSGSLIDCVETVSNANGSLVWTTASVAIP